MYGEAVKFEGPGLPVFPFAAPTYVSNFGRDIKGKAADSEIDLHILCIHKYVYNFTYSCMAT